MKKKLLSLLLILVMACGTMVSTAYAAAPPQAKHLKKDGTPDKRFKENKAAKGPLKKDGTPDMRYSANKKTPPPPPVKPGKAVKPKKK
jgi:hypothetical protein